MKTYCNVINQQTQLGLQQSLFFDLGGGVTNICHS